MKISFTVFWLQILRAALRRSIKIQFIIFCFVNCFRFYIWLRLFFVETWAEIFFNEFCFLRTARVQSYGVLWFFKTSFNIIHWLVSVNNDSRLKLNSFFEGDQSCKCLLLCNLHGRGSWFSVFGIFSGRLLLPVNPLENFILFWP